MALEHDAWIAAIRQFRLDFEQAHGRRPAIEDLLASFEAALLQVGPRELDDGEELAGRKVALVDAARALDASDYEAAYADRTDGGYFVIERRADLVEGVRVRRLELRERTLEIDYEVMDGDLDDEGARRLVRVALLDVFLDKTYAGEADTIRWCDLEDDEVEVLAYSHRA